MAAIVFSSMALAFHRKAGGLNGCEERGAFGHFLRFSGRLDRYYWHFNFTPDSIDGRFN